MTLEKKAEEHEALHSNYLSMRAQMLQLRAAALGKVGSKASVEKEEDELPEDAEELATLTAAREEAAAASRPTGSEPAPRSSSIELPKPLADAIREPLRALDEAATKAIERGRVGLARGLSDVVARLRPEER